MQGETRWVKTLTIEQIDKIIEDIENIIIIIICVLKYELKDKMYLGRLSKLKEKLEQRKEKNMKQDDQGNVAIDYLQIKDKKIDKQGWYWAQGGVVMANFGDKNFTFCMCRNHQDQARRDGLKHDHLQND